MENGTKSGAELISEERERQMSQEGWTPAHDDGHRNRELLWAGNAYSYMASGGARVRDYAKRPPDGWPWDESAWKPSDDPIQNLVKAGALIAAEIDRLQRAGAQG